MAELTQLDPNTLKRIAQGLRAQSQLQGLTTGPEMQMATEEARAPLEQVQGSGFAAQAPNLLNVIANVAERRQGQRAVRGLDARANALRGEMADGTMAQQQFALQQAAQIRQEKEASRMAENTDRAQRDADNIRLRASLTPTPQGPAPSFNNKEMMAPDGKRVNVAIDKHTGRGYLDGQEIPNFSQYQEVQKTTTNKPFASEIKEALPRIEKIKMAENVRNIAETFTPQDEVDLSNALTQVVKNKITPDFLRVYVDNNLMDLSPAAKKYLLAIESGAAQIRHYLSGSALTKFEAQLNSAFLTNEPGLTLKDRMRRIGAVYDEARNGLISLDEANHDNSQYAKKYNEWQEWTPPSERKKTPAPNSNEALKKQLDALENELNGVKVVD